MSFKAIIAATTVLLAATAAESAFAQVVAKPKGPVASDDSRWGLHTPRRSIQHNKGRWSVNLNVEEPVGRDIKAKDVEAGAFFRIAPQLKVGGSLRLDDKFSRPERLKPQDREPQVRLETKFNF